MSTQTISDAELEELVANEIPCGGLQFTAGGLRVSCSKPAVLRSYGHGCTQNQPTSPPWFKCLACWQVWYMAMIERAQRRGGFNRCACGRVFATPSAFSDYRPF